MKTIFVVSDGTGGTARRALDAALTQFPDAATDIQVRSDLHDAARVTDVVSEAAARDAIIVHTLVSHDLRAELLRAGRSLDVPTLDLMGPLLERLSLELAASPAELPGLFRQLNEDYFRRIEAMDFAIRHDDGQRVEELGRADIVLVGVSRTFKTPLSVYLATKGWLVANVPLVLDLPPPPELLEVAPGRVVALKTEPHRLAALRRVRAEHLGYAFGDYDDLRHVRREMDYALSLYARNPGWAVVDVTGKPIEEISGEILSLRGRPA